MAISTVYQLPLFPFDKTCLMCDRPKKSLGLCQTHYKRWVRTGDVHTVRIAQRVPGPAPSCIIAGCDRPNVSHGLCDKHYRRWLHNGDALSLRKPPIRGPLHEIGGCPMPVGADQYPLFPVEKRCSACGAPKLLTEFAKNPGTYDGFLHTCKDCCKPYGASYRISRASELAAYKRAYNAEHREENAAASKQWRAANAEHVKQSGLAYRAVTKAHIAQRNLAWRRANPERARSNARSYYRANRERQLLTSKQSNARRKGAEGSYTPADIRALEVAQAGLCAYCARPYGRYHVEHRTPIIRGGTNWPSNLALACGPCNLRKHTKTEAEFRALLAGEVH